MINKKIWNKIFNFEDNKIIKNLDILIQYVIVKKLMKLDLTYDDM